MQYRTDLKSGSKISILGFGCMRFTKRGKGIDQAKAEEEMLTAIEGGVNYFDTAYIYPGSEVCLGRFLAKGYRSKVYIATKLPHYFIKSIRDADRIFEEECRRLQTEYIDYYLIPMLTDTAAWQRLLSLGIEDWIAEKKAQGRIRQIGFSYHGGTGEFLKLIDAYDWDFCQIQFNYLDEHSQAGLRGLRYAAQKGLPVIVMEPLRGGRLADSLPQGAKKILADAFPGRTPVDAALRWIYNHPEVTCVLSGMNDIRQVQENLHTADSASANALTADELAVFDAVKEELHKTVRIACTGCGYCMPCPSGVDIPVCFRCYNEKYIDNWFTAMKEYVMCTTLRQKKTNAGNCIGCGKCEQHCPQGIPIRRELRQVQKELERLPFRLAGYAAKLTKF